VHVRVSWQYVQSVNRKELYNFESLYTFIQRKGTASVHQILCKSWEKCNGDPGNNNSFWQAKQSILHPTVTVLWQLHENIQGLRPELWQQKYWMLHNDNTSSHTSFFTREFFKHDCPLPPTLLT
jgi:hypothetical protein